MTTLDIIMLVGYFAVVGAIGWWASLRAGRSSEEYFLSGRDVGWLAVGASLFASNISTEHFIGLAGSGARSGLAVGNFEWLACFILLLLGWLFVPFYLRTGVFTMPEFLERRYNRGCRYYLSGISLVAYVLTKISVSLYGGALVMSPYVAQIMGESNAAPTMWLGVDVNMWISALILLAATGAYTVVGGLRAVIYTELFQAFILIGGAVILTVLAIQQLGGLSAMVAKSPPEFFNFWNPMTHPDFPWTGIIFGAPILGVWYWCTDQMIVQRTLAAKDLANARRGTIFAGYLKLLPVFILVLPGIAGAALFQDIDITAAGGSDKIYPAMVDRLLPAGIKGLVIAGLLAALMSSLSAVFNSSSTLVAMDFYRLWRPRAADRELVTVGRIVVCILVALGLLWLPIVASLGKLFEYLQSVQAYISPPIAAVFLLGILWRRANGTGAMTALIVGFVLGAARLLAEVWTSGPGAAEASPILAAIAKPNFLHVAIGLFAISVATHVLVSLATAAPAPERLAIFHIEEKKELDRAHPTNIILSIILVVLVLAGWAYFSKLVWN